MEDELHFLRWFFQNADFGPATGDVVDWLLDRYENSTGYAVPQGYREDEEV